MIETFLACDWRKLLAFNYVKNTEPTEFPDERAISRKFENTKGKVRAFGLNKVFWLFLEF